MGAILSGEAFAGTRAQLAGYAGAAIGVIRHRERPLWFITAVDVIAVILAFGAVRAVSDMVLGTRDLSQGATVQETKGDMPSAEVPVAANTTVLPRLASKARTVIAAVPEELILFAGPSPFTGRFGGSVGAPATGGFASPDQAAANQAPPSTAAPAEEEPPPAVADVPPPQRPATEPAVAKVFAVAERGAAAAVAFTTATTRDVVAAVGTSADATLRTVSSGGPAASDAANASDGGIVGATVQTVASVPSAVSAPVTGTVGAALGLLD